MLGYLIRVFVGKLSFPVLDKSIGNIFENKGYLVKGN